MTTARTTTGKASSRKYAAATARVAVIIPRKMFSLSLREPHGESIENRPKEIKKRESFGHWEMDSIVGCKGSKKMLLPENQVVL